MINQHLFKENNIYNNGTELFIKTRKKNYMLSIDYEKNERAENPNDLSTFLQNLC